MILDSRYLNIFIRDFNLYRIFRNILYVINEIITISYVIKNVNFFIR